MNYVIIGGIVVLVLFTGSQLYIIRTSRNIEHYPYTVLNRYPGFEIRRYAPAVFARTQMPGSSYDNGANNGFRTLASYIFGYNENAEKIAMTSPVSVSVGDTMTMEFMMPSRYQPEQLPKPGSGNITFHSKPAIKMAALSFGGFASDRRIQKKSHELERLLQSHGIQPKSSFRYFGYNPPFQLFGRKNEIVVEVE